MKLAKVFLIGCVRSTEVALHSLVNHQNVKVSGILTSKTSFSNSDFCDISKVAEKHLIPVLLHEDNDDKSLIKFLETTGVDNVFVVGWSKLLSNELIKIKTINFFGYHPAALPKNRGRHPIIWALSLGLNETASTFFRLQKDPDSGVIINQRKIDISNDDYAEDLYNKMLDEIPKRIEEIIQMGLTNSLPNKAQDGSKSNYWRKRTQVDGQIDWRMPAKGIYNLIRALSYPYPGAEFQFDGFKYIVMHSKVIKVKGFQNLEPGKVMSINSTGIVIKCGVDALLMDELESIPDLEVGEYL